MVVLLFAALLVVLVDGQTAGLGVPAQQAALQVGAYWPAKQTVARHYGQILTHPEVAWQHRLQCGICTAAAFASLWHMGAPTHVAA
jgi:hypothetical protein